MSNLMLGSSSYLLGTNDTADVLLNNISPMDANQPNGLAAGIIQVQTALGSGVDLVGTRSSLSERLAVQMPADGRVIPPGTIVMTGRNTAPVGWLICDGAAVDRTLFAALYAAIGNTFGPGNGTTTFNLPDMRGRVAAGVGTGTGGGASGTGAVSGGAALAAVALAGWFGTNSVVLDASQIPAHTHPITDPGHSHGQNGGTGGPNSTELALGTFDTMGNASNTDSATTGITVNNTGGGGSHTNLQPTVGLNFIIRT
jgi:microcystin-dependent protein